MSDLTQNRKKNHTFKQVFITLFAMSFLSLFSHAWASDEAQDVTAASPPWLHGDTLMGLPLKHGPDYKHFNSVNPNAPKGGKIRLSASGGFDTFNAYVSRGRPASGIGLVTESLFKSSPDEPGTMYGLIAEALRHPDDYSWVEFRLNPKAKWHDGEPIDAEDVVWTFNTLIEKGDPQYRFYYGDVENVSIPETGIVRFDFKQKNNKELPQIVSQLTVLPKHYWENRDFTKLDLTAPLGSGPYRVKDFEPNRYVVYERVEDFWGRDIPANVGKYNFDEIRYDYYRDNSVMLEAFKADEFDIRTETTIKDWHTAYDIPEVDNGQIQRYIYGSIYPEAMIGLIFNQNREKFKDPVVREALGAAFDFEWSNRTLFYNEYTRSRSYSNASELEATGVPTGRELEILKKYQGLVDDRVFTTEYNPPKSDGSGSPRAQLLHARDLLRQAGWVIDPDRLKLVHEETGEPFVIDILMRTSRLQRVLLPMVKNFKRLGIDAKLRIVDASQYIELVNNRQFDMIYLGWANSLSLGNEQWEYFGSEAADRPGSRNWGAFKSDVVDDLISRLILAENREELVAYSKALDRVLQWQFLLIPSYYSANSFVLYWDRFGRPEQQSIQGLDFLSWWWDEEKASAVDKALGSRSSSTEKEQ